MEVNSSERRTGMGASTFSALLLDSKFVTVSKAPQAQYYGRDAGYEKYSVEVPADSLWAIFYRSNKGNESVKVYRGEVDLTGYNQPTPLKEFNSWDDADRWASEQKE